MSTVKNNNIPTMDVEGVIENNDEVCNEIATEELTLNVANSKTIEKLDSFEEDSQEVV